GLRAGRRRHRRAALHHQPARPGPVRRAQVAGRAGGGRSADGCRRMSETAPWWAAGGAFALWATREIWGVVASRRKDRTETDANIDLVRGLAERVKSLEESQG